MSGVFEPFPNTENTFLAFPFIITSRPHLLCLHCQLDEDLLQLLVDKVDAELLEPVLLEDLEAVDVEDADAEHLLLRLVLHRLVHPHHQVVKQPDGDDGDEGDEQ